MRARHLLLELVNFYSLNSLFKDEEERPPFEFAIIFTSSLIVVIADKTCFTKSLLYVFRGFVSKRAGEYQNLFLNSALFWFSVSESTESMLAFLKCREQYFLPIKNVESWEIACQTFDTRQFLNFVRSDFNSFPRRDLWFSIALYFSVKVGYLFTYGGKNVYKKSLKCKLSSTPLYFEALDHFLRFVNVTENLFLIDGTAGAFSVDVKHSRVVARCNSWWLRTILRSGA